VRIVLGVGGGIAAYKVASLLRLFTEAGHDVTVIPTEAATRFVGVATWEALSGNPVSNSVFDDVHQVNHVRLGHEADLIVVAPATADLLARAATGQPLGHRAEHAADLAVDHDGVQTFLAAEVFVHDGLGDFGAFGDLLDRGALEAPLREHYPAHLDQLRSPGGRGHLERAGGHGFDQSTTVS